MTRLPTASELQARASRASKLLVVTLVATVAAGSLLTGCASRIRRIAVEDRIARLQRDTDKVRFAIRTTKTLVSRARGARYLPDLYQRLAELYVEQARYQYQIAYEKQKAKSSGVVSVQARLLKNQAIATYRRLLTVYPDYPEADKVLFFMAHEMRELGEYEKMLETYQELADKYPKSEYRLEGLLVMGDHWFDKSKLDLAEKYYRMVLQSAETRVHAMARYKLAWCKINRADFKAALKLFEGSIHAARKFLPKTGGKSATSKIDLRREALVDSVFCYTEVHKPKGALRYFKARADSKTTYLAALDKLGNRYYVKQNWKATAAVYREILSLTGDVEDAVEYAHRLYESVTQGKLYNRGAADVTALINVLRRRYYNAALSRKKRDALYKQFEKYTRFIATKLQDVANEKKEEEIFLLAGKAYEAYLTFFGDDPKASSVRANLAEVLYSAKRYLEAGRYYELAAKGQAGKSRKESVYTAVVSYFEALKLKGKKQLTRLDVVEARAGLRRAGKVYIREWSTAAEIQQVKFNIARTHYDAGNFDEAILLFTALVEQFPTAKEAVIAAHLVLDSYRNKEDYEGLITAGKEFQGMSRLGDSGFRGEVAQIIKGAENALLRTETIKATSEGGDNTGTLEQIANKYKGTALGEKALLNAFVTARNSKDPEKLFEVGSKIVRAYPNSKKVSDVLSTMGKLALDSLQFARGATFLEAAARRKRGGEAAKLHKAAGQIRAQLGDRRRAEQNLNVLLRLGGSAQEKAELAVQAATLHIQAGDWAAVIGLLQRAKAAGAASPPLSYMLGYALFRQGQLASAQGHLANAVNSGKGGSDSDKEAAAAAQFYLAEIMFQAFSQIQLSPDLSQLGATLQQKLGFLQQTRGAYTGVGQLGSATWTVAALGRLANVDEKAALSLRSLQLPSGLPEPVAKQVKSALEGNAAPLSKEAKLAVQQCAATARKFKVLSEAAKSCVSGTAPTGDPQANLTVPSVNRGRPQGVAKLQKMLALRPNDLPTIEKLGRLYLKHGNYYMARMILGKGMEVRETAPVLNLIGVATARLGEHQDAYALFEKALKKEGGYPYARVNKAALLARFGYKKAAAAVAKRIRNRSALSDGDAGLLPGALSAIGGN